MNYTLKYTPEYFDFHGLNHKADLLEVFLMVVAVYIVIFASSWVYNRLGR